MKEHNPLFDVEHMTYTDKNGEKFLLCLYPKKCKIDHTKQGQQITEDEFIKSGERDG